MKNLQYLASDYKEWLFPEIKKKNFVFHEN